MTLIMLCWAVYTLAYLGRYSYNSNVGPIMDFYRINEVDFALPTTLFFFAYGSGQIINGLLCRHYNLKYIIPGALIISSIINISVYFGIPFSFIKYLWLMNGISQSVLWSSLLLLISQYVDPKNRKLAIIIMSTTVSIGTFMAYGFSALFAIFDGFKYSFLLATVCMSAISILWFFLYSYMTEGGKKVFLSFTINKEQSDNVRKEEETNFTVLSFKTFIGIVVLYGIFAIIVNFVKDGLQTWIPKFLKDSYGLSDSISIVFSLVLPVFGVFGAVAAVLFSKKIKNYSDIIGIFFLLTTLCVAGIISIMSLESILPVVLFFGLTVLFMHGSNNVITSMLPLSFCGKYNAGLVAGLLNGACYVGSTLSQIVIAAVASKYNWDAVLILLLGLCFFALVVSLVSMVFRLLRTKKRIK